MGTRDVGGAHPGGEAGLEGVAAYAVVGFSKYMEAVAGVLQVGAECGGVHGEGRRGCSRLGRGGRIGRSSSWHATGRTGGSCSRRWRMRCRGPRGGPCWGCRRRGGPGGA